jgi:hypothetical protein
VLQCSMSELLLVSPQLPDSIGLEPLSPQAMDLLAALMTAGDLPAFPANTDYRRSRSVVDDPNTITPAAPRAFASWYNQTPPVLRVSQALPLVGGLGLTNDW